MTRQSGKSFTVMVVPHSEKQVMSFTVSLTAVQIVASVIIIGCLSLLVFANLYADMRNNMAELNELRIIAKEQKGQIDYLAAETDTMQANLDQLSELDRQIRDLLKTDKTLGALATDIAPANQQTNTNSALLALAKRSSSGEVARAGDLLSRNDTSATATSAINSLEAMKTNMVSLSDRLAEAQQVLAERNSFLRAKPSIYPVRGHITSTFGYRRSPFGWSREFHDGLDIAVPYGTPVLATADGVVVTAGWDGGFGRAVEISHGYGYRTLYGHNSRLAVRVGQSVKKGQVIAYSGSSGRSTGPHVHYSVFVNGRVVNPRDYLR